MLLSVLQLDVSLQCQARNVVPNSSTPVTDTKKVCQALIAAQCAATDIMHELREKYSTQYIVAQEELTKLATEIEQSTKTKLQLMEKLKEYSIATSSLYTVLNETQSRLHKMRQEAQIKAANISTDCHKVTEKVQQALESAHVLPKVFAPLVVDSICNYEMTWPIPESTDLQWLHYSLPCHDFPTVLLKLKHDLSSLSQAINHAKQLTTTSLQLGSLCHTVPTIDTCVEANIDDLNRKFLPRLAQAERVLADALKQIPYATSIFVLVTPW